MPNIESVIATINGQEYKLTLNSTTGMYEAVITAPAKSSWNNDGHYYGVTITATDTATNQTIVDETDEALGSSLQLRVKETVAPVVSVETPAEGALLTDNKPQIQIRVIDNDSGVDTSTFQLQIDDGTAIGWDRGTGSAVDGGWLWTYTPDALGDGAHTISASVSDYDGNISATASSTVTVDTTPPALDVQAPQNELVTNKTAGTVVGTTNDVHSKPVTVTITVNGKDQGTVAVDDSGSFSHAVTYSEGENTLLVTATDAAGKSTSVTRTVYLNTVVPKITAVTIEPNPVNAGSTYTISVSVE